MIFILSQKASGFFNLYKFIEKVLQTLSLKLFILPAIINSFSISSFWCCQRVCQQQGKHLAGNKYISPARQLLSIKKLSVTASLFITIFVHFVSYFIVIIKSKADCTSVTSSSSLFTIAISVLFFYNFQRKSRPFHKFLYNKLYAG